MKRTRSVSRGAPLKRRKAMTKEDARAFTEASTAVLVRSRIPRGLPRVLNVKLRYFEQITLDPVGGGVAVGVFRANSGYDPYQSGAGHQPKYTDQYFAMFDKAVVKHCKIIVKGVTATSGNIALFGISLRNDTTAASSPADYVEDSSCTHAVCSPYTPNQEVIVHYKPAWFGDTKSKNPQEDAELHYTAAADAAKVCYAHCWVGAVDSTQNPTGVDLEVLLEYDVEFFEPNSVALS